MEQQVGRYRLIKRLAAGGMGEVFLAAHSGPEGFTKVVALKRMLPTAASERELVRLFLDEARLVAKLAHRNIAQIFDLGEDADGYYVALEYVPGPSIRLLIDRLAEIGERIPPPLAVEVAAQVADALGYAYTAPSVDGTPLHIVHRDVTPQNVLVSVSGDVKLIDFGVAKSKEQQHATQGGTIKGKLAYMSPEQSRGHPVDGRSDLFSLGIVLYEMLTGTNPFWRGDLVQMVLAIQNDAPPPLSQGNPQLAPLDPIAARLLAKRPEERFGDGNELYEELTSVRSQLGRPAKRLGPFVADLFGQKFSEVGEWLRRGAEGQSTPRPEEASGPSRALATGAPVSPVVPPVDPAAKTDPLASSDPELLADTFVRPRPKDEPRAVGPQLATDVRSGRDGAAEQQGTEPDGSSPSASILSAGTPAEAGSSGVQPSLPAAGRGRLRTAVVVGAACLGVGGAIAFGVWQGLSAPVPEAMPEPAPTVAIAVPPGALEPPEKEAPKKQVAEPPQESPGGAAAEAPLEKAKERPRTIRVEKSASSSRKVVAVAPKARPSLDLYFKVGDEPTVRKPLLSPSGPLFLFERSGLKVSLRYSGASQSSVRAVIHAEPWALVFRGDDYLGRTPVELPPIYRATMDLELKNPNLPPVKLKLFAMPQNE
ncbi:MAG: protein kinase [Myxococcales bacterium]|nr:protein kinase [Myxococcales bacterium]